MSEKRERGEGRLFLRGKTWWAQYYYHGQQVRISTEETDEKKAARFLRKKLAQVSEGTHTDSRNLTYEGLREMLLTDYQANSRKSLHIATNGKPYIDNVKRLDGYFAGSKADEIDADEIRKFQAAMRAKGLANGSINRSVSSLGKMFALAQEAGKLREIPHFPRLKESAPRQGFIEPAVYERLYDAMPEYLKIVVAIGYFTGMRLGEILRLEWKQVDLIENVIRLRAGETKNDQARTVPLLPTLRSLLAEHFRQHRKEFLLVCFNRDRLGNPRKIGNFLKAWRNRCVTLGLGSWEVVEGETVVRRDRPNSKPRVRLVYHGLLFHDLRRSAVRSMVRAGIPEVVAMRVSGHKTRAVFDRYNIVSDTDLVNAATKLESYFQGQSQAAAAKRGQNGDNLSEPLKASSVIN
jgi:integrase